MFPLQILELLLYELKNPKLEKLITADDLDWMFVLYKRIRHNDDKYLLALHILAKIILIERGLIKG